MSGTDISTIECEFADVVPKIGGYGLSAVEIRFIRPQRFGSRTTIVRCPVQAAREFCTTVFVRIGWSNVMVERRKVDTQQCTCCWEYGHTVSQCRNSTDRMDLCFKCNKASHSYKVYKENVICTVFRKRCQVGLTYEWLTVFVMVAFCGIEQEDRISWWNICYGSHFGNPSTSNLHFPKLSTESLRPSKATPWS